MVLDHFYDFFLAKALVLLRSCSEVFLLGSPVLRLEPMSPSHGRRFPGFSHNCHQLVCLPRDRPAPARSLRGASEPRRVPAWCSPGEGQGTAEPSGGQDEHGFCSSPQGPWGPALGSPHPRLGLRSGTKPPLSHE